MTISKQQRSIFRRSKDSRFVKIDSTDLNAVAWAKARIAQLYAERSAAPASTIKQNRRFHELEIVFAHLWRGRLPDDDAGRDCLFIAACHIWHLGRKCGPDAAIGAWTAIWAPWCDAEELAALIQRVEVNPQKWTADEMAQELGPWLTFEVRQALGLTTIGSVDLDKAGRLQRRAENSKERSTEKRRRSGAVTRAEYEAKSESRTKPWLALGISRATYKRRQKREISSNTPKIGNVLLCSDLSHGCDFAKFGISAITVMRRTNTVASWHATR